MHYDFGPKHQTPRDKIPAMPAGVMDAVWTLEELVRLLG
jgi:hypothetical protein